MRTIKKFTVYLGDLVHNAVVKGPFTMPLNIGYVGAYAKRRFGDEIDIKLFKYPLQMINAIKEKQPHLLALGNYTWNTDLNYKMIEFAKGRSKETIAVLGGPNFPIDQDEQAEYLMKKPAVDFYVRDQGEIGFSNLLETILGSPNRRAIIKNLPIRGCIFLSTGRERLITDKNMVTCESINDFPSPYLSGMLDEFFAGDLIPLIETDRGCPYTCVFCAWGKTTNREVKQFEMSRVKEEIDYIIKRVKYTDMLFIANANFGIFERDREIAEYIKEGSVVTGYPRKIDAAWAKNTPKQVIKMAETLGDMAEITISFQSLDENVLRNVKRSNINASSFIEIQKHFAENGVYSTSEIILGLPGETRDSHLNTLKTLFDIGAGNVVCYNCRTLGGTVLDTKRMREKHDIRTKYRLYDIGFGKYNGIISIEADEVVRSTNTLSEKDILCFRALHWLIQFLWGYRYYHLILRYLISVGVNPVDFMIHLISNKDTAPDKVMKILEDFEEDAIGEWFDSPKALFDHYSNKENFNAIMKGAFGKLNFKYTFKTLYECRKEFDAYLADVAKKIAHSKCKDKKKAADNIVEDLVRYMRVVCIDFDDNLNFERERRYKFDYDILKWEEEKYSRPLADYYESNGVDYIFYISDDQHDALKKNIKLFSHKDRNVTLRKMSEYMKKADLFYKVSRATEKIFSETMVW